MKLKNSTFKYSALSFSVMSILFANPVMAAEESDSQEDARGIEVLEVTARRTAENPQKVPVSISNFSEKDLEESGVQNIADVESYVPNATFNASRGTNST